MPKLKPWETTIQIKVTVRKMVTLWTELNLKKKLCPERFRGLLHCVCHVGAPITKRKKEENPLRVPCMKVEKKTETTDIVPHPGAMQRGSDRKTTLKTVPVKMKHKTKRTKKGKKKRKGFPFRRRTWPRILKPTWRRLVVGFKRK